MSNVGARAPKKDKAAVLAERKATNELAHADRVELAGLPGRPGWPHGKLRHPVDDVEEEAGITADMEAPE